MSWMGCPHPVRLPDLGWIEGRHVVAHALPAVSRTADGLTSSFQRKRQRSYVGVQAVPEEDALPGHEHHAPVVVLKARPPAAGVLNAVQEVYREARTRSAPSLPSSSCRAG